MQQDLAGVHRLKDGHLKDSTDSTAIELKFPIGLKICVSIIYLCIYIMYIYIYLSLSLKYIYIYHYVLVYLYTCVWTQNILEAGDKSYRHQPWISNWDLLDRPHLRFGQSCMHLMNLPVFKGTTPGNHRKSQEIIAIVMKNCQGVPAVFLTSSCEELPWLTNGYSLLPWIYQLTLWITLGSPS